MLEADKQHSCTIRVWLITPVNKSFCNFRRSIIKAPGGCEKWQTARVLVSWTSNFCDISMAVLPSYTGCWQFAQTLLHVYVKMNDIKGCPYTGVEKETECIPSHTQLTPSWKCHVELLTFPPLLVKKYFQKWMSSLFTRLTSSSHKWKPCALEAF